MYVYLPFSQLSDQFKSNHGEPERRDPSPRMDRSARDVACTEQKYPSYQKPPIHYALKVSLINSSYGAQTRAWQLSLYFIFYFIDVYVNVIVFSVFY